MELAAETPLIKEAEVIRNFFSDICHWYDFYNRLFSCGMDIVWRRALVRTVYRQENRPAGERSSMRVLDLATGSGDVALMLQKKGCDVIGLDFCEPLLQQARQKGARQLIAADALDLPFEAHAFDAITVAFGFRNFTDWPRAAKEALRVLKPGGWFYILEFSQPAWWIRSFYFWYLKHVLPRITGLLIGQKEAYMHLYTSVAAFPSAAAWASKLQEWGFSHVRYKTFTFGIVALHIAQSPCILPDSIDERPELRILP